MTAGPALPNSGNEDVYAARRRLVEREEESARLRTLFRYGFMSLYVATATASQLTMVVLLNYLVSAS